MQKNIFNPFLSCEKKKKKFGQSNPSSMCLLMSSMELLFCSAGRLTQSGLDLKKKKNWTTNVLATNYAGFSEIRVFDRKRLISYLTGKG